VIALLVGLGVAGPIDGAPRDLLVAGEVAPPPLLLEGEVDRPPVFHYAVRLPGERVGSGSHAERSRPVVYGDLVLVGAAGGRALYAVSRRDGTLVREYPADAPVESAAVVRGADVLFSDSAGTTWRYALDGTLRWRHAGTAPVLVEPTVTDAAVLVADVEDLVVALDPNDGSLLWRYEHTPDSPRASELALFAAPAPLAEQGVILAGFSDGAVVAIEADTGDERWKVDVGEGEYPDVVAAPFRVGADLLLSGYFSPFVAFDLSTRGVRWRVDAGSALPPLVVRDGEVNVAWHGGTDGHLRAVDVRTGEVRADLDVGGGSAVTGLERVPAGLLVATGRGGLALVDPSTAEVTWKLRLGRRLDGLTAPPTVSGRQILLTTHGGRLVSLVTPRPEPPRPRPRYPGDPEAR
jgi:outer membrane protein assembly factor BamB